VTAATRVSPLAWWVLACSFFSAAGWVLSWVGALTASGYGVVLAGGMVGAWALWHSQNGRPAKILRPGKWRWRARHVFPLIFHIYAVLALLSGILYAPSNFDALSYRLPRVLHWLAAHQWHWIVSPNDRLNVMSTGFEWSSAPVLALASTDRFLFVINTICFLLFPGLLFGVFTRLGISKKVAWNWMWLLPTGYCFVLQAGSLGNDLFSTVFCLGAVYFALRARESGQEQDLWLSVLAAALLTGAKASNLPLLLPWALALLPSARLALNRSLAGAAVLLLALGASFLPTALANIHWTGHWGGDPLNRLKVQIKDPVYGIAGNSLELLVGNGMPPVMPFVGGWNTAVSKAMRTAPLKKLTVHFPRLKLDGNRELAQEESAGIGLGMCALLLISIFAAWQSRFLSARSGPCGDRRLGILVWLGAWGALLGCMSTIGSEAAPRLFAPYYPLLFGSLLLLPRHSILVQRRWWRVCALLAALSALPPLILSPARPLWPALKTCHWLQKRFVGNALLQRASTTYQVYRDRNDALAPLRAYIPSNSKEIGFVAGPDEPEASLWRPFGSRIVLAVTPDSEAETIGKSLNIAVVRVGAIEELYGCSVDGWLARNHLHVLGREKLILQVQHGQEEWLVVQVERKAH
jgi:hypothetical protein